MSIVRSIGSEYVVNLVFMSARFGVEAAKYANITSIPLT